jgi:hypothetical protein
MRKESYKLEKIDAFVVTKPLQYINVLNIEAINKKVLLLVDLFINADIIFKKIEKSNTYWDELYFFHNMDETFTWLIKNKNKFNTLYIDSDINRKNEFFLLRKLNISIYEEGIGTYQKDHYKPRRKVLGNIYLLLLRLVGHKNRRGGNKYTKNIIVYFPEFYKEYVKDNKKYIRCFSKPFLIHINECRDVEVFENEIDFSDYIDKTVAIYISDWGMDEEAIKILDEISCEKKIIKPHPHQKNLNFIFNQCLIAPGELPAEILILKLMKIAKKLYIISKYSTSTIYYISNPKVEVINLNFTPMPNEDFESFMDAYLNLKKYINNICKYEEPLLNL